MRRIVLGLVFPKRGDIDPLVQREWPEMLWLVITIRPPMVPHAARSIEVSMAIWIERHLLDVRMVHIGLVARVPQEHSYRTQESIWRTAQAWPEWTCLMDFQQTRFLLPLKVREEKFACCRLDRGALEEKIEGCISRRGPIDYILPPTIFSNMEE